MKLSSTLQVLACATALALSVATSAFAEGMGTIRVLVGDRTFERQVNLADIPNMPNGDEDVGTWLANQGFDNPSWVSTKDGVWVFEADSLPGQAATASAPVAAATAPVVQAPQPVAAQAAAPTSGAPIGTRADQYDWLTALPTAENTNMLIVNGEVWGYGSSSAPYDQIPGLYDGVSVPGTDGIFWVHLKDTNRDILSELGF